MGYLLGIDLGSSSVKASLLDAATGVCVGSAFYPETEAPIAAPEAGFAEQNPADWYDYARSAIRDTMKQSGVDPADVKAIGIAYQMHGLVCTDASGAPLRPAIIWCDSRAVPYGEKALAGLGTDYCLEHLLNSPGNFTASKLAWVKAHQPEIFAKIDKILLPGDWLALQLTGQACTTASGLSEGILWDFGNEAVSKSLLDWFGFDPDVLAPIVPSMGMQGALTAAAAQDLGLAAGTPVTYRAGDQPNNALSLNVFHPGEVAATAGTSGVIYGITDRKQPEPRSRVNTFLHVNHAVEHPRLGVLLCISGTGILNAWTRRLMGDVSYRDMDEMAGGVAIGSEGLSILPFGNGPERALENRNLGARVGGLDFNRHGRAEICRAVQEGIVFSFQYGMEIMKGVGLELKTIRAGHANMFMSDIFSQTLAGISGATIELYDTDGALGAARGAGVGAGIYASTDEAFATLERRKTIEPSGKDYASAYARWKQALENYLV